MASLGFSNFSFLRISKILFRSQYFSKFFISASDSLYFSFPSHSRLISLWAKMTFRVEEIKKGSTFISIKRGIAPAAEVVCRVDNTKCPVRAALMARLAVSLSLTSPTMIMSGS